MPKKPNPRKDPEFYESLTPSMSFGVPLDGVNIFSSTPLWIYPAWIIGSIILGVLFGLAVKDFQNRPDRISLGGIVAGINDPYYNVVSNGLKLSASKSQIIQGDSTIIQANQTTLQGGRNTSDYQNSFSSYGQQGSVGTAAAMK